MIVGFYNWSVKIGGFDVNFYESTMERYNSSLRKRHIDDMLIIFGYLESHM